MLRPGISRWSASGTGGGALPVLGHKSAAQGLEGDLEQRQRDRAAPPG